MNRLSTEQRAKIVGCLVEGNSIRATVRLTGAAKGTVSKLLCDLGEACSAYQDGALRNLRCERIQIDEIWAFVGCKQDRYSPERCLEITINKVSGSPDPAHISTSFVERQNLSMRMGMGRFTRLSNGFSRKVENLAAAVSLHFMYYNFARPHTTLAKAANHVPTTCGR